uniref:Uncharacterized protein n=1 Tax=Heliothis virescens TaxID=7102 RepID=A0A2A4JJH7_HELVI
MSSESDPQPQSSSQSDNQSNEQNDAQDTISRPILESPNNLVHPVPIPTNEMPRGPAVHANIIYGPSAEIRLDGIRFDVPINVGGMEDFTLEVPVAQASADPIPDVVPHASVTESAASAPVDPEPGASSSSGQAPKALPNLVPIVTLEETMILNDPSEDDLSSAINSGSTSTSDTGSSSWVETVPLSFVTGPKGSQDITAHIEPSRPPIQAVPAPPATSSMPPPSSPPATSTAPATSSASAMSPASGSSPALALSSPSSPPSVKKGAAGRNKLGSKPSSPKRRKRPKKDPSN